MPYRFSDRTVNSAGELLANLHEDQEAITAEKFKGGVKLLPEVWYRGLPSTELKLLPTLHRSGIPVTDEVHLMNRFKQNAHEFLDQRPQGEWEWMLLARHHGLPSRLLDWTENALVGLFFATNGYESHHYESDGVLWCLFPARLNEVATNKTIRSDVLPMLLDESEATSEGDFLDVYKTSRLEGPTSTQNIPPAAAISIRTTKRIQAQLGVFTIHHVDTKPLDEWGDGAHVWRYIVPSESKKSILEELRLSGITELTVFPELDNVANEAMRGYRA